MTVVDASAVVRLLQNGHGGAEEMLADFAAPLLMDDHKYDKAPSHTADIEERP